MPPFRMYRTRSGVRVVSFLHKGNRVKCKITGYAYTRRYPLVPPFNTQLGLAISEARHQRVDPRLLRWGREWKRALAAS
jgi:hypothetical protein